MSSSFDVCISLSGLYSYAKKRDFFSDFVNSDFKLSLKLDFKRLPVNSSHDQLVTRQLVTLYKSTRHTVNSAYSQLVADIVTKRALHLYYHSDVYPTSKALKQNTRTRLAVIEYLYRKRRAVPLQTITTRHSNRKQTTDGQMTDGTAIA